MPDQKDEKNDRLDDATIRYGDGVQTLRKSRKYIGVKTQPGASRAALSEIAPHLGGAAAGGDTLGGFRLVNVEAAGAPLEETLDALREDEAVNVGTHVFHNSEDEVPFVPTGLLYIECSEEATPEQCQELIEQYGLQIVEARGPRELIVQVTEASGNPVKTAAALQQSPLVKTAEPDLASPGRIESFQIPVDVRLVDQWHLRNAGFHRGTSIGFRQGADARVVAAWQAAGSLGSPNVVVAVIDDGFDLTHPDLTGSWKLVAPKDFTRSSSDPRPDPLQEDWHGTACAGVAVGNADGTGIVGAAPRSRLMPIRWGTEISDGQIENWFGYAREQGAWVVSCSWSARARNFPLSTRMARAIQRAAREGRGGLGCVICFAAGNQSRNINDPAGGSVNGFAAHPDVIAVAASNSRDQHSTYSNFGAAISVCAPSSGAGGWGITTSDVMGQYVRGGQTFEAGYSVGAYTDDFGGTSSACPLVAGICALILAVQPTLTAAEVKSLVERTARKIGPPGAYDARGHSTRFGNGCIDAAAAIGALTQESAAEKFWGAKGHGINNRIAIGAVPAPLRAFYERFEGFIEQHAMDADNAKKTDPEERPRHFIDLDLYGAYPFSELPEDWDEAVDKFGEETVLDRGIVPWQIEETYGELVSAFSDGRIDDVLCHSAWLGHYVGDAHVPLHTTANHDGQLTGQKGLHSSFETKLLQKHVAAEEIKPATAKQINRRPRTLAFEWVRESHTYVKPILDADAANGGKAGRRNLKGFAATAKPIAVNRLTKSCSRLAGLWYSAWIEAGRPVLEGMEDPPEEEAAEARPVAEGNGGRPGARSLRCVGGESARRGGRGGEAGAIIAADPSDARRN